MITRVEHTAYEYGADGIRVSALYEVDEDGNGTFDTSKLTTCLNDPLNITGYSQVLKQIETDNETGEQTHIIYIIGHQRISQIVTDKDSNQQEYYFTFDGHGSTRVLTDLAGAIVQLYNFDAYGNALGFNPADALTEFLYSGEQFDSKIGQQYLRARYYDPATGRFNRLDPFFGNLSDPQSFHKYLYAHNDPVNGIDPSGLLTGMMCSIGIAGGIRTAAVTTYQGIFSSVVFSLNNYSLVSAISELSDGATSIGDVLSQVRPFAFIHATEIAAGMGSNGAVTYTFDFTDKAKVTAKAIAGYRYYEQNGQILSGLCVTINMGYELRFNKNKSLPIPNGQGQWFVGHFFW